jgi:hypothetical protein
MQLIDDPVQHFISILLINSDFITTASNWQSGITVQKAPV